eukprot:5630276-Pleurochrysis_carterae.AAC.3
MYVAEEHRQGLVDTMRRVRDSETLTQAEAALLCGKLGLVTMWTWGRSGKAVMQPIIHATADGQERNAGRLGMPRKGSTGFPHIHPQRLPRRTLQVQRDPRLTVKI